MLILSLNKNVNVLKLFVYLCIFTFFDNPRMEDVFYLLHLELCTYTWGWHFHFETCSVTSYNRNWNCKTRYYHILEVFLFYTLNESLCFCSCWRCLAQEPPVSCVRWGWFSTTTRQYMCPSVSRRTRSSCAACERSLISSTAGSPTPGPGSSTRRSVSSSPRVLLSGLLNN